jgi:hypothetical protein
MGTELNIPRTSRLADCKPTKGPFRLRSEAVAAAERDPLCLKLGAFTIIKTAGYFDYVHGEKNILMSADIPQSDHWLNQYGQWRHKARSGK